MHDIQLWLLQSSEDILPNSQLLSDNMIPVLAAGSMGMGA